MKEQKKNHFNRSSFNVDAPCLNCTDRYPACQSDCERYDIFRSRIDKVKENREKECSRQYNEYHGSEIWSHRKGRQW